MTRAATAPAIAPALIAATEDDPAKLSNLTTAIVTVLGERRWAHSELEAWLDCWLTALADRAAADVPRSMLEVVRREAGGDASAHLSLPPELRAILPEVRVAADDS